eukprot:2469866-Pyramimonas_sp.AAC.1
MICTARTITKPLSTVSSIASPLTKPRLAKSFGESKSRCVTTRSHGASTALNRRAAGASPSMRRANGLTVRAKS